MFNLWVFFAWIFNTNTCLVIVELPYLCSDCRRKRDLPLKLARLSAATRMSCSPSAVLIYCNHLSLDTINLPWQHHFNDTGIYHVEKFFHHLRHTKFEETFCFLKHQHAFSFSWKSFWFCSTGAPEGWAIELYTIIRANLEKLGMRRWK